MRLHRRDKTLFLIAIYLFFHTNISYSDTNTRNNSDVTVEVGTSTIGFSENTAVDQINQVNEVNIDAAIEMLISGHQAKMAEVVSKYRELAKLPRCTKSTRELIPGTSADSNTPVAILFFDAAVEDDRIAAEYSTAEKVPYEHGNPLAVALAGEYGVRCLPTLVTKGEAMGNIGSGSGFVLETGRLAQKVLKGTEGSKKRTGKKRETK